MPSKKQDTSNQPWVKNYPPLAAWLEKHQARCSWQLPVGHQEPPRTSVECWLFSGTTDAPGQKPYHTARLAIITIHCNKMGWEIYTPCASTEIVRTLRDAEARLGLERTP